jgi:hypothetical protein
MEQLTEQEKTEAKAFLPDLETLLKTFGGLESQMVSEPGRQFCDQFCTTVVAQLRQMKAEVLVALDMI